MSAPADTTRLGDLMTLTKARLSALVIVTTFLGYLMHRDGEWRWLGLLHATLGTALAAASAAVFNQYFEARVDRLMERTRERPLAAGRMKPSAALALGTVLGVAGCAWLYLGANALAAALAALTIVIYIAIYTPLKRRSPICVLVGAVSGAIPPVIGWVAAKPTLDLGAWVLFAILFTWQMPHFLAIAWMYRAEYAGAGFVMLPPDDPDGRKTALRSFAYTLALALISVVPFTAGMSSSNYLAAVLLLDAGFLLCAGAFVLDRERPSARRLFLASILFLPLLLGLMVVTKI